MMATYGKQSAGAAWTQETSAQPGGEAQVYRLRLLPNEDVHLFVKRVDNSRVRRQSDPVARGTCWRLIGGSVLSVVLLVGLLSPKALGVLADVQIHRLQKEEQKLLEQGKALDVELSRLRSTSRMQEVAALYALEKPERGKVIYLNPRPTGALALNAGAR